METPYLSGPLQTTLYRGTFNVYANGNYRMICDGFDPWGVQRNGGLYAVPCKVNGYDAFIVRNQRGGPAASDLGMEEDCTLFEIVSATYLREKLGVTDRDIVRIEYNRPDLKFYPISGTK